MRRERKGKLLKGETDSARKGVQSRNTGELVQTVELRGRVEQLREGENGRRELHHESFTETD